MFDVPILFLIFNRLEASKRVFAQIKRQKPKRLYISSDGARESAIGEKKIVDSIRNYILSEIDWDCSVSTLFRNTNFGCGKSVYGAIDWFFENEEYGIILEDDCLPSDSFFLFCKEMLLRYIDDERIYMISGYNRQDVFETDDNSSYFFSNLGGIWGWAGWRRAFKKFDWDMKAFNYFVKHDGFKKLLGDKLGEYRRRQLESVVSSERNDIWGYRWGFARNLNSALSIVPKKSLIKNIGFGENATHTKGLDTEGVELHELDFPLVHNQLVKPNRLYDHMFFLNKETFSESDFIHDLI